MTPRYLGIADAATYIGRTERFMRRLVHERRLRFYKVGKFVTFDRHDLDNFIQQGRVEPAHRLTGAAHG